MKIPNYIRPQLTIKQLLQEVSNAVGNRITATVIGPQYKLNKYNFADDNKVGVDFDATGVTIPYTDASTTYKVDGDFTKVYGEGLEAVLASLTSTDANTFRVESVSEPNVIKYNSNWTTPTGNEAIVKGVGLETEFNGRDVKVGDIFDLSPSVSNNSGFKRTVIGFRGVDIPASVAYAVEDIYNPKTQTEGIADSLLPVGLSYNNIIVKAATTPVVPIDLVNGPVYNGKFGERFTLEVLTGGYIANPGEVTFKVSSLTGTYSAATVTPIAAGDDVELDLNPAGVDLIVQITSTGTVTQFVAGQKFSFTYQFDYTPNAGNVANAGTFTGPVDTSYILEVTTGGALASAAVKVTDSSGLETTSVVSSLDGGLRTIGTYGLQVNFAGVANGGLKKGDKYIIVATAESESTTQYDKIILSGPAVDTTGWSDNADDLEGDYRLKFSGNIDVRAASDTTPAFTSGTIAEGISVRSGLEYNVIERTSNNWVAFKDGIGKLYGHWRALVPPTSGEGFIKAQDVSELRAALGMEADEVFDMDSELPYAANIALTAAAGRPVYFVRTAEHIGSINEDNGITEALQKIESTDLTYAITALVTTDSARKVIRDHVEAMSVETVKNFRRAYVGLDSPGEYTVLGRKSDGITAYKAAVSAYTKVPGDTGNYRLAALDAEVNFTTMDINAGDLVRINYGVDAWGTENYTEVEIEDILSESEAILKTALPDPISSPGVRFEVWKSDTADNTASYINNVASSMNSRRFANVWCDSPTIFEDGISKVIPTRFIAAEIAGLRSALYPQQGLTRTEIALSATNAPNMYVKFRQSQLDDIAAHGTMIITQDVESGTMYIRHQLTTLVEKGILYYEDSVGVNLDNISFEMKDVLDIYIGKRNATPQTVNLIQIEGENILTRNTSSFPSLEVGPALIGYENLVVAIDPVFKDTINYSVDLIMPTPLNRVRVTLKGKQQL